MTEMWFDVYCPGRLKNTHDPVTPCDFDSTWIPRLQRSDHRTLQNKLRPNFDAFNANHHVAGIEGQTFGCATSNEKCLALLKMAG
jgi:hypothetical protein